MYQKGDIVLIPFPFTDLTGVKIRPAVVLVSNKKSPDIVVVFITSQIKKNNQFAIQIEPSKTTGLKVPSTILIDKLATLDKKIVVGKLGSCDDATVAACDTQLRLLLRL